MIVMDGRIETIVDGVIEGRAMWASVPEALAVLSGGDPIVLGAAGASAAALACVVQTPGLSQFVGCRPLGPVARGIVLAAGHRHGDRGTGQPHGAQTAHPASAAEGRTVSAQC